MATVSKRGDRQWQAKVRRKGHVASATFETKARAEAWARQIESDIDAGRFHPGRLEAEKVTLAEALDRYLVERVPLKKGIKQNTGIVKAWKGWALAGRSLAAIRASDVSAWRDEKLKEAAPQTVVHHLSVRTSLPRISPPPVGLRENRIMPARQGEGVFRSLLILLCHKCNGLGCRSLAARAPW